MSSSFLKKYKEDIVEEKGIPNFEMNAPVMSGETPGDIGLEFELEGNRLLSGGMLDGILGKKSKATWVSKEDGSLRNGGREYVLSTPCYPDELSPMVTQFFERFASGDRVSIINSNRCSTHVHVNILGYKINELTSAIALWKVFEEALLQWCGEERQTNHFCLSSSDEESVVQTWTNYLKNGNRSSPAGLGRGLKYTALNLLTIYSFGSLEFRCMGGANEPTRPIKWATFCYNLVRFAKENYPNPGDIAYDLSERGAAAIFRAICDRNKDVLDDFYDEVVIDQRNERTFDTACIEGFRDVQGFVLGFPWGEWMELINREYVPNPFAKAPKKIRTGNPNFGGNGNTDEALRRHREHLARLRDHHANREEI